ncbi:hypothetical protein [uncultured Nostoc sp.]|uniref:hypothetical protein n=1 Tax=uncultured Nostoc sp. TaxID=340711 RepID=UPI0035C98918
MRRLSMAALGVAFIAMATVPTLPAEAALLEFNFTTKSSGTGTFILDTDTARDPNPALFTNPSGSFTEGISYPGAISDFTFSAPSRSLSNLSGDFGVFPSIPFAPNSIGVNSGLISPAGCLTAPDYYCSVRIDVQYLGNLSELPVLSTNPLSYFTATDIKLVDPPTGKVLSSDPIISFRAVRVPESDSVLGLLAIGVGGAALLLKRKYSLTHLG